MHDIQFIRGPKRIIYKVLRHCGDHHVFGHNSIPVGQWWPLQICALRDGAHGSVAGGMSHQMDEGVRSVVLNTHYDGCDVDDGEVIWYSMPGSTTNADPNRIADTAATEAMQLSRSLNRPIRVLRGKGAGWNGRPSVGIRYDGLYRITDEETGYNSKGGLFVRFKLERLPNGQPPLRSVTRRPNEEERLAEARVKDGY